MKLCCPNLTCSQTSQFRKDGFYYRASDSKKIQRYLCSLCKKSFSKATFAPAYRQKKRRINVQLKRLLSSGVSLRRAAILLGVSRKTIERRFRFLGSLAQREFDDYWREQEKVKCLQFDDLHTIEHTKCKPLSVTIAVDSKKRKIIGIEVSKMPAAGTFGLYCQKKIWPQKG